MQSDFLSSAYGNNRNGIAIPSIPNVYPSNTGFYSPIPMNAVPIYNNVAAQPAVENKPCKKTVSAKVLHESSLLFL